MSQYFDKTFFKFLLGFVTIVAVSLVIILATHLYEKNTNGASQENPASAVTSTN